MMFRRLPVAIVLAMLITDALSNSARAFEGNLTVVVLLDDSGSMKQPMPGGMLRIDAAKQALNSVLSQLPPETRVGVVALNTRLHGESWIVPMGPIGNADWKERIASIRADGGTMLGLFSKVAADELLKMRAADRYGTYRLLIVTDGEANDPAVLSSYLPDILSRGITLDVIGVSMASEHSLANLAHSYRSADDAESLTAAISTVFAETQGDTQSTQSDFELLQGIEDGVAEEVLKSLAVVNNDPIKEVELSAEQGGARFQVPAQGVTGGSMLGGFICCLGTLIGLVALGTILIRAVSGTKKRRR